MSLVDHIDVERLQEELLALKEAPNTKHGLLAPNGYRSSQKKLNKFRPAATELTLQEHYVSRYTSNERIPKYRIPDHGVEPGNAYQMIHDMLNLDGTPILNLASFVNTYVSDESSKLINENLTKNLADNDEYPAMIDVVQRCVSILGGLWNVPSGEHAIGSATTGSSEAVMLGGLTMKRRWEAKMKSKGQDTSKPNIIMAASVQVALEKFARYFDVEARIIPVSRESNYVIDLRTFRDYLDENTIGVFAVLGSTYTGHFDNIEKLSKILDEYEEETGNDIPIHVDGASGAFIAPFLYPKLKWDFRLPRVKSINASGHKFGLTSVGLGWIIWRDREYLPDNLVFQLKYLGAIEESYTLNFSRPGHQVIHQYYLLIHLGREGYKRIHSQSLCNARLLSRFLEATGYFECVSDIHRRRGVLGFLPGSITPGQATPNGGENASYPKNAEYYNEGLPVVSFKFTDEFKDLYPEIPQAAISTLLRIHGFIIPNYPLPPSENKTEILRIVCRMTLTLELLDKLMSNIVEVVQSLIKAAEAARQHFQGEGQVEMVRESLLALVMTSEQDAVSKLQNKERRRSILSNQQTNNPGYRGAC